MKPYVPALSKDWNAHQGHYDIVIIGSGYGGSIMAARLSAAAYLGSKPSICLLERGKEWKLDQFPDKYDDFIANIRGNVPFRKRDNPLGLYDIVNATDITVLKGSGLGGTSLVNANVAIIPEDSAFQQSGWPASLNRTTLDAYYKKASDILLPHKVPNPPPPWHTVRKRWALEKRAEQLGMKTELAHLVITFRDKQDNGFGVTQPACTGCGDCITGCRVGAKNTLYMNYLPWAWHNGVDIFTQNEVQWIEQARGGGWVVHGVHRPDADATEPFQLDADRVILSAGSINSTEILLRSKQDHGLKVSDHVGTQFSGNGDFFGISYNGADFLQVLGFRNHPDSPGAQYPPGPTITTKLQYDTGSNAKSPFLFEDVSFPTALFQEAQRLFPLLLGELFSSDPLGQIERATRDLAQIAPYSPDGALNHSMLYLVMALDNAGGTIQLKKSALDPVGKPDIVWHGAGSQPIFETLNEEIRQHAKVLASTFIENPTWAALGFRHLVTAHPLGGCPISETATQGATNEFGQVFKADGTVFGGLRVVDGSLIPSALGVNPLFTISALAERIADHQIQELRNS